MRFIIISTISIFLSSGLYAQDVSLTADGKVPGKPFEVMQAQIDALNIRVTAADANTSTNTDYISQLAANSHKNASGILDNELAIGGIANELGIFEHDLSGIEFGLRNALKCAEVRVLVIDTMYFLLDEIASLPIGAYKELIWHTYSCDESGEIIETEHIDTLDADGIRAILDENGKLFWEICGPNDDDLNIMNLVDLYQNYNQAMSTLSSIMKSQHDTLRAIISN